MAEAAKVFVKTFKIHGATLIDQATINRITTPYQDKELTLSEIQATADLITAAYRQKGFLIANAFVPAQDIIDGTVIIQVIEGKIGSITITGNKHYTTEFIRRHLQKIRQDPSLKEGALIRPLLLLNDYPSLLVSASLRAGTEPGTTDIVIIAQDSYPISVSVNYDNFGTRTLSKHRMSLIISKGNTITDGDTIRLTGITGLDRIDLNRLSYGRIDYLFPVGYSGTKAGIYYANNLYEAGRELAPLSIEGRANIAGIFLTHPFIKTIDTTLSLRLAFDYKDINDYMLDSLRSRDNIRVVSLGINYDTTDNLFNLSGRNIIGINYHQGLDIFGGSGKNDGNTSRLNADGQFSKFTFGATRIQRLANYTHLVLRGSGQYSNEPLFVAEQFSIGGAYSVRGFNPSIHSGDSGYNLSAELLLSPIFAEKTIFNQKVGDTVKFALFVDHAGVFREDVQPSENKNEYLTGIGAGIRLFYKNNFSARVDYALPRINGKFKTKNSKVHLQATMSF